MKRMKMSLLGLIAFFAVIATFQNASADVRVRATLTTPSVRVHVGNTSEGFYRGEVMPRRHDRFDDRYHNHSRINGRDRMVATRLARYTGVPSWELIDMRRHGYRWVEIGRWLELPRFAVRAAMSHQSWKRFLRDQRHMAKRKVYKQKRRHVAYMDRDLYQDFGD